MANRVVINDAEVSGNYLLSARAETSHAMVGETLAADQFYCEVSTESVPFIPADQTTPLVTADDLTYYAKNGFDVDSLSDGDEVYCYSGDTLLGKYYLEEVKQTGASRYKISSVSIIGRLLDNKHYGGIYVQRQASEVLAEILDGITYTVDPSIAAATITGYLPIADKRDNLQQVLAATGSTVKVDNSGALHIEPMSSVVSGAFGASRCFEDGSVTLSKPVVGVKVTEHNYIEAGNDVVLFNDGLDGTETIEFREPYHDLTITGGTIIESGANYARIRATGTVTLTGKPYTHVTRIVTAGNVNTGKEESVKTVSSCYLANPQIAQAIADRFFAYLQCNCTINQDVLVGSEKAGDVVSVINPYTGEMVDATIKKFDMTLSGVNRANAEFLVGFVPAGVLSGFTNHVVLTDSGSWTVPSGVTKIRIILVGAGGGGSGGKRGSAGENSTDEGEIGTGGTGGAGGKAGVGGRVFEISLDVTPGEQFSFACGIGGNAGNGQTDKTAQSEGTAGTPTTFGNYSSDYGRQYPYGYFEAKTGLTFAAFGLDGYKGGDGGDGNDEWEDEEENRMKAEDGGDVAEYSGGLGSKAHTRSSSSGRSGTDYYGGGGGGAAYGSNGGDAPGTLSNTWSSNGGDGATGIDGLNGTNYGQGGGGGHGGGGGGGAGTQYAWNIDYSNQERFYVAYGGDPGDGTNGGFGGDGVIIVYY